MKCPNCGEEVRAEAEFCPYCGTNFAANDKKSFKKIIMDSFTAGETTPHKKFEGVKKDVQNRESAEHYGLGYVSVFRSILILGCVIIILISIGISYAVSSFSSVSGLVIIVGILLSFLWYHLNNFVIKLYENIALIAKNTDEINKREVAKENNNK